MEKKVFRTKGIVFKEDEGGEPGEFKAAFAQLNVVDHDGDVTVPGAFMDGQQVRISYWGHRWQDLPVGRGEIHADGQWAWVDGKFFLNTEAGRETYQTVKELGDLQEWSYGFDVNAAEPGVFDGQQVNFLKALTVYEVSPVMLGAGIGTHTVAIKAVKGTGDGADDDAEDDEGGAGDGEPSGVSPRVVLSLVDILEMED